MLHWCVSAPGLVLLGWYGHIYPHIIFFHNRYSSTVYNLTVWLCSDWRN